jgi:ubiquitin-activating enzyme E1
VKVPHEVKFVSLKECYENPVSAAPDGFLPMDMSFWGRSANIHAGVRACHQFFSQHKKYPHADKFNEADEVAILEITKSYKLEELNEDVVKSVSRYSNSSITCLCAFFGGIVAQEVVKYTGKYSPLRQWLHYDIAECVPAEANREPMGNRYDD